MVGMDDTRMPPWIVSLFVFENNSLSSLRHKRGAICLTTMCLCACLWHRISYWKVLSIKFGVWTLYIFVIIKSFSSTASCCSKCDFFSGYDQLLISKTTIFPLVPEFPPLIIRKILLYLQKKKSEGIEVYSYVLRSI